MQVQEQVVLQEHQEGLADAATMHLELLGDPEVQEGLRKAQNQEADRTSLVRREAADNKIH